MKIYLQDREKVVEMPREMWITKNGTYYSIMGTAYIVPVLGSYNGEERAKEILKQIFESYQNGKKSYVMPEQ